LVFLGVPPLLGFFGHLLLLMLCWASQHHDWVFLLLLVLWQIQYVVKCMTLTHCLGADEVSRIYGSGSASYILQLKVIELVCDCCYCSNCSSVFSLFSRVGSPFISISCSLICCLDLKCLKPYY
jgi:hypothetical protein